MAVNLPKGTTDLSGLASLNNDSLVVGEGSQTVNAGLDQSGLTNGISNIYIAKTATVSFQGSSGGFLKAGISGTFKIEGYGGQVFYTPLGGGTITTCARLQNLGSYSVNIDGGGTLVNLENNGSGSVFIGDGTNVTNISMSGGTVNQLYKSTPNTTWRICGGTFNTGRGVTTGWITGGAQVTVAREDTGATRPAATTLYVMDGTCTWRGGDIATLYVFGNSRFDVRNATSNLTIADLYVDDRALRSSWFKSLFATVTISNLYPFNSSLDAIRQ